MAIGGPPPAVPAGAAQVHVRNPIESKRQRYFAFALVTSLFFTWGFCYGLLDVLNKHFVNIFGISKLQSTMMQTAYFGAYFVFAIPAGQFASRFGYKALIHVGLTLYMIGAFCFWPSATTAKYYGFVLSTVVIGSGLVSLEVAANSYISVLGPPESASARLVFSQSFQAVAAFTGPLIASHTFFKSDSDDSLTSVQYVYLGVGLLGLVLNILFFFCKLPEISEDNLQEGLDEAGIVVKPLWEQWHTIFGFLTQFAYVGAQVCVISFVMFYIADDPYLRARFTDAEASNMVSYLQITFMMGRFLSTPLLNWLQRDDLILFVYSTICAIFTIIVMTTGGRAGLASLFIILFFESIQFPVIFVMGTSNLGRWTKRGSSLLVMGVGGGAAFPPMQGAISDNISTTRSYGIPLIGFVVVMLYSLGMMRARSRNSRIAKDVLAERGNVVTEDSGSDVKADEERIEKSSA
ncbi:MFS general substrate transporter [Auriculariales sp. MPI-PUGE-AT-0066]|nr:MFS general substrate transporter [Auriculariales sp. MPI-PUGE-AT-0066]